MGSFVRSALVVIALAARGAVAQDARTAQGVVRRAVGDDMRPLTGAWVVLHRVGNDRVGPVDSVRTDARGTYAFRFGGGRDSAAFFASTAYLGVTYFTAPFTAPATTGDAATIMVYDTASTRTPVHTRGRHMIVFGGDSAGLRQIVEVFWLENPAPRTRVATAAQPSWWSILPDGAADLRVEQGDVASSAVRMVDGRVAVFAPIAPGLRQLQVVYTVPARNFPLAFAVSDSTMVLEVLVEGATGRVDGASLAPQATAVVEQRTFRRYRATNVATGALFVVTLPQAAVGLRSGYLTAVLGLVGAVLMFAFVRATRRAPGGLARVGNPTIKSAPPRAEAIAAAVASLDARFARLSTPTDADRAAYQREREQLKSELTAVLAERDDRL